MVHQVGFSFKDNVPSSSERKNNSFSSLVEQGRKSDLNVIFSNMEFYNRNKKQINIAWTFEDGKWSKIKNKKFDMIFYRGRNVNGLKFGKYINRLKYPMRNNYELENLCCDKILTSIVFPRLMPKTFLINNHYDLQRCLKYIRSDKVVIKPRFGSLGRGVVIIDKKDLKNGITRDTVLQEFIDSSNGVKSLKVKGSHDLRCVIVDGKIDHSYFRLPKRNSFLGNMEYGATKKYIDNDEIPKNIKEKVNFIDKKLKKFGERSYSADFLIDNDKKAWLVELNSKPGTSFYDNALRIRNKYHFNLTKSLRNYVENL